MGLIDAKHNGFIHRVNVVENGLCHQFDLFGDNDHPVKIALMVNPPVFYSAFQHLVGIGINITVDIGTYLFNLVRTQVPIVDAVFQRIFVNRFLEVIIRVHIVITFGRCC